MSTLPARPGARTRILAAAMRRLGPRYAVVAPAVPIQVLYLVAALGLAGLSLYVDMSLGEFARLLCATLVIQTAYNAFLVLLVRRAVRPLREWLAGDRSAERSVQAWCAGASLPVEFLRTTTRYGFYVWANAAWSAYAVWDLGLPVLSLPAVMVGVAVAQVYGFTLIVLALERIMRPVLAEISEQLPDAASLDAPGIPVRWRLLAALPAINVITGVTVAGLSAPGGADLSNLWVDVLLAIAVAFSVSFWLTLRLSQSLVVPLDDLHRAAERAASGDLRVRVPIVSTDETGRLGQAFNRMMSGLEERERLRAGFGAFVDPDLAEHVAAHGTDIDGTEADISALFVDVRDFTALAERCGPQETVATLNSLYDCVVPVVARHGGHANKFIGDGMLAVFGAPSPDAEHADHAIGAALEIAEEVRERFGDALAVGVGVNSGRALAGTVGGGGRLDFTVIGDTVNTAARVEAATRDTDDRVLITAATRQRLTRDHGRWEPRAKLELKGKAAPVEVFAPAALEREDRGR